MSNFSGTKLREARGKRTQTWLSTELQLKGFGTTQTQVSRWESGQEPRRYIIPALAEVLGVDVDDLFDAEADAPFRGAA